MKIEEQKQEQEQEGGVSHVKEINEEIKNLMRDKGRYANFENFEIYAIKRLFLELDKWGVQIEEGQVKSAVNDFLELAKGKGYSLDRVIDAFDGSFAKAFVNYRRYERGMFTEQELQDMYERAKKRIDAYVPDPHDFTDIYPIKEIEEDLLSSNKIAEQWKDSPNKKERVKKLKSEVIELVVGNYLYNWMNLPGDDDHFLNIYPTSKPDDYGVTNPEWRKGFDYSLEYIEYNESGEKSVEYGGASLDITSTEEITVISKKITVIVNMIKNGYFPKIKYFEDGDGEHKGVNVIPFVLVLPYSTSNEILKLFKLEKDKELMDHRLELSILHQMKLQAELFISLSKKYENTEMSKMYEKFFEYFNHLSFKKAQKHKERLKDIENSQSDFQQYNEGMALLTSALSKALGGNM